ncbi:MAG TPA: hypothetical protein PLP07_08910 [Pyrinomonadaceae bacterium]|nr:hypothetical protein [Pyrinomonadaceae bacterium]
MRVLTFSLVLYIFVLAVQPCADSCGVISGGEQNIVAGTSVDLYYSDVNGDECSAFCMCSCCGVAVAPKSIHIPTYLRSKSLVVRRETADLSVGYVSDDHSSIWQPPKA